MDEIGAPSAASERESGAQPESKDNTAVSEQPRSPQLPGRQSHLPSAAIILSSVLIVPLLIALLAKAKGPDWPYAPGLSQVPHIIDVNLAPAASKGTYTLEGQAPAGMELGIYLNDKLLSIRNASASGTFQEDVPILPARKNTLTALPVNLDPSTLLVFYATGGYQEVSVVGDAIDPAPPPYISIDPSSGNQSIVEGSTLPDAQIELCLESCNGSNAVVSALESDDEGSFRGAWPSGPSVPTTLFARIQRRNSKQWIPIQGPIPVITSEAPMGRSIELWVSPRQLQATFWVEMSDGYAVYQNLVRGDISPLTFVHYIFGDVVANTYMDPRLMSWRSENASEGRVRVYVESQPLVFLVPQDPITTLKIDATSFSKNRNIPPYGLEDQVILNLQDTHLLGGSEAPSSSTRNRLMWLNPLRRDTLTLTISRNSEMQTDQPSYLRIKDALADIDLASVVPVPILRETLEGGMIGLLPAKVPLPAQEQIYDYYRGLYIADPLIRANESHGSVQEFLAALPSHLAGPFTTLLLGALWLSIPLLLFLNTANRNTDRTSFLSGLASIGWLTLVLILLSLDWRSAFPTALSRHAYITADLAAHSMLLLLIVISLARTGPARRFDVVLPVIAAPLTLGLGLVLFDLPDAWISILLSAAQILAFLGILWLAVKINAGEGWRLRSSAGGVGLLAVIVLSIPIQSLPINTRFLDSVAVATLAIKDMQPLLPLAILVSTASALLWHFDGSAYELADPAARRLGRVLFAAFVVGLTPAWSFIPVSILFSTLLFEWIFPATSAVLGAENAGALERLRKKAISDLLQANRRSRLRAAIDSSLQKQLRGGDLQPAKYYEQQEAYEAELAAHSRPSYIRRLPAHISVRNIAFNFGGSRTNGGNAREALAWGGFLLIPLLLLSGIPLATTKLSDLLPYPFIEVAVQLGSLAIQFLGSAFFLGFFFPQLRGRNGLEKAAWLAGATVICLLPTHLLVVHSTADISALVIWAGSILAYDLLLGLLAFDLQALSANGFSWDRLGDLYNFRDMALVFTGSGAPLIATIISAVGGNINDLVPALLRVVFPTLTLEGSQSALLKVVLNIVSQLVH